MSYTIRLFIKEAGCPIKTKHLYAQEKSQQESGESNLGQSVYEGHLHCTDTNQYMTAQAHEEQQRSIEPSKALATEAPVQADLGYQPGFPQMMGSNQQKQEQSGMSYGAASQQLGPSAGVGRLPLPKLKTLVRSKSNSEQVVENTQAANIEGTSSQMQQRKDFTLSTSSYNSALSTQAENSVSSSARASPPGVVHADIKTKCDYVKLGGKSLPKLNLFTRSEDKNVVDRQEDMEKNRQQCSSVMLLTTDEELPHLVSPPSEVEQEIPSEVEQVASKALDGIGPMEVSHSHDSNQQAQASVPSQADHLKRHEVVSQHGGAACDFEEGEFYDAEGGNLHGCDKVDGEENDVDEGRTLEAPSISSPRSTPGFILI